LGVKEIVTATKSEKQVLATKGLGSLYVDGLFTDLKDSNLNKTLKILISHSKYYGKKVN
jgi:hypothetical protein